MEQIYLRELRKKVDDQYVGLRPNGNKLKPVHMAGGEFRKIVGKIYNTENIKRFSYVINAKGMTPTGNDLESIMEMLKESDAIDNSIKKEEVESLRKVLQDILGADNGVFYNRNSRVHDGMVSFSAGSRYFLTGKAKYEENGEFIASIIETCCPELTAYIRDILTKADDPISILLSPVSSDEILNNEYSGAISETFELFGKESQEVEAFINSVQIGGSHLLNNFKQNKNFLSQLRMFNFFCIYTLIRYMSMLEDFYCEDGKVRPLLVDFTSKIGSGRLSSVANASMMSYTLIHSSIARFYAWAYAQQLKEYSIQELLDSNCPRYDTSKTRQMAELEQMWDIAKDEAKDLTVDDEKYFVFGKYIYEMLALESDSSPVNFMKNIGVRGGLLYPLDPQHPHKRFVFSQDIIEMVIRCCVDPGEVLSRGELRSRLWSTMGIVIGGSGSDIMNLEKNGMILQVDSDSLESNFDAFAEQLQEMGFAEMLADGILQIRLNNNNYDKE